MADQVEKVRICHSTLTGRVVLARFGRDPNIALAKKDASSEFWQALVSFAFDGKMPQPGDAAEIDFGGGDEQFTVSITRKRVEPAGEQT